MLGPGQCSSLQDFTAKQAASSLTGASCDLMGGFVLFLCNCCRELMWLHAEVHMQPETSLVIVGGMRRGDCFKACLCREGNIGYFLIHSCFVYTEVINKISSLTQNTQPYRSNFTPKDPPPPPYRKGRNPTLTLMIIMIMIQLYP